ncbi:hypothetical protein ACQJBY_045240 [Aegilops geniculata]
MLRTGARRPRCALCGAGADVHCHADAAFLCATCHAQAHCTSSLASRHRLTRVPPEPNHARAEVSARAMGLGPWVARLRPAAAGRTRVPPPSDVRTQVTARAMGLDPWAVRLRAAAAGRTRVPPPSDVRGGCGAALQLLARRVGLDAGAARLRAAAAFRTLRVEFAAAPRMPLRVAMAAALWREVAAHGGVHEPGHALQRLATWAHAPTSFLVAVAAATGRAREVRTTAAVDVEEDSVDCAIVSPRRIPQELSLFV